MLVNLNTRHILWSAAVTTRSVGRPSSSVGITRISRQDSTVGFSQLGEWEMAHQQRWVERDGRGSDLVLDCNSHLMTTQSSIRALQPHSRHLPCNRCCPAISERDWLSSMQEMQPMLFIMILRGFSLFPATSMNTLMLMLMTMTPNNVGGILCKLPDIIQ